MHTIVYIFLTFVIVFGLLGIIYINCYNIMHNHIIRLNEAESMIDESLRVRYDLINSITKILKKETKLELKEFKELNDLKKDEVSSFDFDRATTKCIDLVYQIKKDYPNLDEVEEFRNVFQKIKFSEEKIEAAKIFYNAYTTKLNKLISKFPSNIIARIHRLNKRYYFDGKNMDDDIYNDFKL